MAKHFAETHGIDQPYFYAGKAKPQELNDWLARVVKDFPTHHVIMTDIKRCETNKHAGVVAARMWYYAQKWEHYDEYRDTVLRGWKNARFKYRNRWARISGRLPPYMTLSGEDFTSLDNSFDISIAVSIFLYCALHQVMPNDLGAEAAHEIAAFWESGQAYVAGSGDDLTIVVPQTYRGMPVDPNILCEQMERAAEQMGFLLTHKVSRALWDVVFLGMRPYFCSDGRYRFGRLIGRASKSNHFARALEGDPYNWLANVAQSEMKTMTHVPLLWHKARRVDEVLTDRLGKPKPMRASDAARLHRAARWLQYVDGQNATFTERTWAELAECYDVSKEALQAEVTRIDSAEWFPYALSGEVWDRIFEVDLSY